MDEHLQAALRWLKSKTRTAYSQVDAVYSGLSILPLPHALGDGVIQGEKYILLHKGRVDELVVADMANLAGRSKIVFCNDVYVILRSRNISRDGDAVKSFFLYLRDLKRSIATKDGAHGSGRFCHYIGNDTVLTETVFRRKIYLDSTDISITPHIMYNGEWEPWVTRFISATLQPNDVVVDIGANCGFFTLLAADIVGPGGLVVAIEPQAQLRARIDKSIAVNGFGGFVASRQVAVGEASATAQLIHVGDYRGSASIAMPGPQKQGEDVSVQTLPDIIGDVGRQFGRDVVPNFIKIDVEGFEVSVWRGMRDWIKRLESIIIITEFSPISYLSIGEDPKAYLEDIMECGFAVSRLHHDATETPFGIGDVAEVIASSSYADLILRRGAR